MRVGFSGFFLDRPDVGSGQYARNLVRELAAFPDVELVVFCPSEATANAARALAAEGGGRAEVALLRPPRGGALGKLWFEQVGLPRAARHRVEALHVPYFGSPLWRPTRTVVTVHDLIMLLLPEYRGSPLARLYTGLVSAAARRADLVIADSEQTRNDLIRLLGLSPGAIRIVPLGCEPRFRPVEDAAALAAVRRKYELDGPFILYLGGLDARKNLPLLFRAFAEVDRRWRLAIGGQPAARPSALYPDLRQAARAAGVGRQEATLSTDRVSFLGWVAEEDKPALYSAADLFVFPSLYEGFGLTPLEAMACGVPVACSNAASLPEVVDGAALLFDPDSADEMADAMERGLANPALRAELRRRGLERAARFSWRATAEAVAAAYRATLPRKGPSDIGRRA